MSKFSKYLGIGQDLNKFTKISTLQSLKKKSLYFFFKEIKNKTYLENFDRIE
jgi:hypothetical protein